MASTHSCDATSDIRFDLQLLGGSVTANNSTTICYTADGSDPRLMGGALNPTVNRLDPDLGFSLPTSAAVIARTLNGTPQNVLESPFEVESVDDDQPVATDDSVNVREILSANLGRQGAGWAKGNFNTDDKIGLGDFLLFSASFGWNRP